MVKNLPVNAGDTGKMPLQGRSHMPQGNYQAHVLQLGKLGYLESMLHKRNAAMRSPRSTTKA